MEVAHTQCPARADTRTSPADSRDAPPHTSGPSAPRVLVITQNASVPADRRVWNELIALRDSGYEPVAICPQGDGFDSASFRAAGRN